MKAATTLCFLVSLRNHTSKCLGWIYILREKLSSEKELQLVELQISEVHADNNLHKWCQMVRQSVPKIYRP